jgi:hypothetical protein
VSGSEAASRAARQGYHTGQGQDEHAAAYSPCPQDHRPLHGLDSAWSWAGNPHRESGTRSRAAADVGQTEALKGAPHARQKGADGDRLGDSVGPLGRRGMLPLRQLKDGRLIAGVGEPHAIDDAHPHLS